MNQDVCLSILSVSSAIAHVEWRMSGDVTKIDEQKKTGRLTQNAGACNLLSVSILLNGWESLFWICMKGHFSHENQPFLYEKNQQV